MKDKPMLLLAIMIALVVLTNKKQDQTAAPTPAPEVQADTMTFKVDAEKAWTFMAFLVQEGKWTKTDDVVVTAMLMHEQGMLEDIGRIEPFKAKNQPITDQNRVEVVKTLTGGKTRVQRTQELIDGVNELDSGDDGLNTILVGCRCNRHQRKAERAARIASRVAATGWGFQAGVASNGMRFGYVMPPNYSGTRSGYQAFGPAAGSAYSPPTLLKQTDSGWKQEPAKTEPEKI